jgi:predicted ABC-type ATPase
LAISASFPTPLNNLSNSRIDFSFLSNTCFYFIFETVFSTQEKLDFIQQVIDAEYFVRLFFIATDSYKINNILFHDSF